jgi:hypothetical protein
MRNKINKWQIEICREPLGLESINPLANYSRLAL